MDTKYFIAGDWGTSSCRLYLFQGAIGADFSVLESIEGDGVSKLERSDIENHFFNKVEPWLSQYKIEHVLLSGMVGATIGWREASYANCPASIESQLASGISFNARGLDFTILGGVKTLNALGLPDVMRGEETQLIGVTQQLASEDMSSEGASVVILPGTHNKWAILESGSIRDFFTAFTGELFAILSSHSILTGGQALSDIDDQSFEQGIIAARDSQADIVHLLFSTRSTQLASDNPPSSAPSYMLGLVIGRDIASGLDLVRTKYNIQPANIGIIANDAICETYRKALFLFNIEVLKIDAEQVAHRVYPKFFESALAVS